MNFKRVGLGTVFTVILALALTTSFASAGVPTNQILDHSPTSDSFINYNVTYSNRAVDTVGLPWKQGETWNYSQDMHGSDNNGLDFGTPNGKAGNVYAVASGVVEKVTNCAIIIRRSDGLKHGYQHVAPDSKIKKGVSVSGQTYLGKTALCDGSKGHHVHFWLHDDSTESNRHAFNPVGWSFGGWKLVKERDESEKLVKGPDPSEGYDYVLKKRNDITCAGTTIQNKKNICTRSTIAYTVPY